MTDPTMNLFERPIYLEEAEDFGKINLDENRFNAGVSF